MAYTIASEGPHPLPGVRSPVKLTGSNVPVDTLTAEQVNNMYDLMTRSFDNVKREKFIADLYEKDGVILFRNSADEITGFSTWLEIVSKFEGNKITAIFSGDTIIDEGSRGQVALFRQFIPLLHRFMETSGAPVYWFLLSKGIRTYLMLPIFFKSFHPCVDTSRTTELKLLTDHLASERYGDNYNPDTGILKFNPPADRLKVLNTLIPERLLPNINVRYFLEKNPGYIDGDELVCLAEINKSNFTRAMERFTASE